MDFTAAWFLIQTVVFEMVLSELCDRILGCFVAVERINTIEKALIWIKISNVFFAVLCALLYALLLYGYLHLVSRKFVKKDCPLQKHENIFLILPCAAALCISVLIKMVILSVENGMTVIIYDTLPATKFLIPVICALLLSTITTSVVLFQKLVRYNEEAGKCAILENQMRQMQREIVEIQDIYTDMRGLRHDMRSHLANISLLVKSAGGSVSGELESYIGKMEATVSRLDFTYQTGNPITDIIIHQKGQEAEKKQIKLHSYVKGSLFFIEVENDFSGEIVLEQESGLPVSSKENGKLHGLGLSNIQRCARKYMGDIDITISDTDGRKKFILTVMMNGKAVAET